MYIYMSDEEDNIDIKIDVAYKWDVIFSPSLKQTSHLASGYAGDVSYSSTSLLA